MQYSGTTFLPLKNMILRRLGFGRTLAEAALETEVLQPAVTEQLPLPLCLPGEIDKATGTWPNADLKDHLRRATAAEMTHAPVYRHILQNCVTGPRGVEYQGGAFGVGLERRAFVLPEQEEVDQACYPMTTTSRLYFGHYLHDACAASLLQRSGELLLLEDRPDWPDAVAYCDLFGLEPTLAKHRFVRNLNFLSDYGLGPHKALRLKQLRQSVFQRLGGPGVRNERVYLRRPDAGAVRLVANEARLMEDLSQRGFRIVDPNSLSLAQLADQLRNADLVITMEGSHATHAYFLTPPGAGLCVLIPGNRFGTIHRFIAHAFGAAFGYCVCPPGEGGYDVDVDVLLKTVELFD